MQRTSTILIRKFTRARLREIGKKGQTYDALINELIDLKDLLPRSCTCDSEITKENLEDEQSGK